MRTASVRRADVMLALDELEDTAVLGELLQRS